MPDPSILGSERDKKGIFLYARRIVLQTGLPNQGSQTIKGISFAAKKPGKIVEFG